ncbi:hypothetical protein SDC9_138943 [bioreactor metagenome]|uniref:Uncharacterized protein n=1 Tax=bioreactor metagenome TaxID=1076179 RepID=A0A645DRC6_9ZZZZ
MIRKGIAAACEESGISDRQIMLLDGSTEENAVKLEELLTFGVEFDGVVFYSFFRVLYEMVAAKLDLREKCRVVCDESALPEEFSFTGYVIDYLLDDAAKTLVDNLLQQVSGADAPVIAEKIGYRLHFYQDGKPCINR